MEEDSLFSGAHVTRYATRSVCETLLCVHCNTEFKHYREFLNSVPRGASNYFPKYCSTACKLTVKRERERAKKLKKKNSE